MLRIPTQVELLGNWPNKKKLPWGGGQGLKGGEIGSSLTGIVLVFQDEEFLEICCTKCESI